MAEKYKKNFLKLWGKLASLNLLFLLIVALLFFVLIGKGYRVFLEPYNVALYSYGLIVTTVILLTFFISFTKYKDPYLEKEKVNKNYLVSCLVAVRNEEKIIRKCVNSFLNQTYKNKEIIFVNDASTDKTGRILDEYANKGLIKVIHLIKNVGKKKALGKAIFKSRGDIFLFSDSDSVLAEDTTEKIVSIFSSDKNIGAVSGHCRALNGDKNLLTKIQDSWYEGQFSIRKAFESVFGSVTCVSGPLAAFRKEAVFNFIPAWEDDTFLGQEFKFATDRTLTGYVLGSKYIGDKLKKQYEKSPFVKKVNYPNKEWKIVYSKSAKALTNVPENIRSFMKQQIRWKKSFIRNIFLTGAFYWRKPILPALFYYLHILFVIAGPFIVFFHLIYLPLSGNIISAFLYLSGIAMVGFMFALAYKMENKEDGKWIYRPLMSLMSTLILSWLIFYSVLTIKRAVWYRG